MKSTIIEWLVVFAFILLAVGATLAEAWWLAGQGWAGKAKSICFSFLTNLIGFMIGGFLFLVALLILFMMVFEKKIADAIGGEVGMWVLLIAGMAIVPVLLMLSKRLFLWAFKMRQGRSAWAFSVISSIAMVMVSVVLPVLGAYLLFRD